MGLDRGGKTDRPKVVFGSPRLNFQHLLLNNAQKDSYLCLVPLSHKTHCLKYTLGTASELFDSIKIWLLQTALPIEKVQRFRRCRAKKNIPHRSQQMLEFLQVNFIHFHFIFLYILSLLPFTPPTLQHKPYVGLLQSNPTASNGLTLNNVRQDSTVKPPAVRMPNTLPL